MIMYTFQYISTFCEGGRYVCPVIYDKSRLGHKILHFGETMVHIMYAIRTDPTAQSVNTCK